MSYAYEFDDTSVGDVRFARENYATVHEALRMLRDELAGWNKRALDHGTATEPYKAEVDHLDMMIGWGADKLAEGLPHIVVNGISVGSRRYQKAALLLMVHKREHERTARAREGWPSGTLQALDAGIDGIRRLADAIQQEPSEVLSEILPQDNNAPSVGALPEWDIFVSHASEDKEDFARPLAEGLQARGLKVWFDEFTLTIGDSLRRSIDRGLSHSRFGVVVISHAFLRKDWPQKELDGLVAREVGGVKVILPVWHGITAEQLRACSPMLADKVATNSAHGLDHVIVEIARALSRDQQAPTAQVACRPLPATDVRVTLKGAGRSTNFVIENLGPGIVRNVGCELDTAALKESPIIESEWQEKLPVEVLRPGARVEMIAALADGTGTTFRMRWWWREDDGRVEERNEKVSLQSW
jgi:hypothetical protein